MTRSAVKKSGVLVPNHIAIIPDGNRRWARARGLHTLQGHKKGFDNAVDIFRAARNMGIHTITIWGFSTENWDRSQEETNYLMKLYETLVKKSLSDAQKEGVKIHHLGRKDRLPQSLIAKLADAEEKTAKNKKFILNIALDYGGQDEILRAVKGIFRDNVTEDKITPQTFEKYLDTADQPYPYIDLIIRTSGEQRTSGFVLWQSAYAETYWEQDHFPSFTPEKLWLAVQDYSRRRRRFGGNDKVKHLSFEPKIAAKLEVQWWRLQNIPEGTKFRDYALQHIREQFGLSKALAHDAAKLFVEAIFEGKKGKWKKAVAKLKEFYEIIKSELKLTFEPSLVASLEVQLWQKTFGKDRLESLADAEDLAKEYYAEVYRVSLFQAAKASHLRIMALRERNIAERGMGEIHWQRTEDYLRRFYAALREQVA